MKWNAADSWHWITSFDLIFSALASKGMESNGMKHIVKHQTVCKLEYTQNMF